MTAAEGRKKKLGADTLRCLQILSSLVKQYEAGNPLMYVPMAAQLRILFCDKNRKKDNSLLGRLVPKEKFWAFRKFEYTDTGSPLQLGVLPFQITRLASGVILADFDLSSPPQPI